MTNPKRLPVSAPGQQHRSIERERCQSAFKSFAETHSRNHAGAYKDIINIWMQHVRREPPRNSLLAFQKSDLFALYDSDLTRFCNKVADLFGAGSARDLRRLLLQPAADSLSGEIFYLQRADGQQVSLSFRPHLTLLSEEISAEAASYNSVSIEAYELKVGRRVRRWEQLRVASHGATIAEPDCGVVCVAVDLSRRAVLLEEHVRPFLNAPSLEFPRGYSENSGDRVRDFLRELKEETGWLCSENSVKVIGRATPDNGKLVERVTYALAIADFEFVGRDRDETAILDSHWVPLEKFFCHALGRTDSKILLDNGNQYRVEDAFTIVGAVFALAHVKLHFPTVRLDAS